MDERLAAYVDAQWTDLVDYAQDLCISAGGADDAEAQDLVLSTLTRVAGRWWVVPDRDHPDAYVRRKVELACLDRDRKRVPHQRFQLMEVGAADSATSAASRDAVAAAGGAATRYPASEAVAILERRTRRVRRTRLSAAVAVIVLVGVGAASLNGSGGAPARRPAPLRVLAVPSIAFPQNPMDFASGVTAGDGAIWTIESRAATSGSRSFVVERDPVSGRVEERYGVPEADDHIAFGLGRVWAWHDNTDFPRTIATVDGRGDVASLRSRAAIAVHDATFTSDAAWFTEPAVNSVVRFVHGVLGDPQSLPSAGARFAVPASASSVLVAGPTGRLRVLPGDRVVDSSTGPPTLLSPAPAYGIWIGHGRRLTYQSSVHAAPTVSLTLPLRVGAVLGDPAHGVYVATRSEDPLNYDPYLVYYSPSALRAPNPQPTDRLDGLLQAEGMVANPAGGIVFVTNQGTVDAWDPGADTL